MRKVIGAVLILVLLTLSSCAPKEITSNTVSEKTAETVNLDSPYLFELLDGGMISAGSDTPEGATISAYDKHLHFSVLGEECRENFIEAVAITIFPDDDYIASIFRLKIEDLITGDESYYTLKNYTFTANCYAETEYLSILIKGFEDTPEDRIKKYTPELEKNFMEQNANFRGFRKK